MLNSIARGAKSKLAGLCLGASMLTCLLGACRTTPTSTAYRQGLGTVVIGETVGRLINPNAYKSEPRETAPAPVQGGEYFIVVNRATGESKEIKGPHWYLYAKIIKNKKPDEYPEGYIMYLYNQGLQDGTSEWDGKKAQQ